MTLTKAYLEYQTDPVEVISRDCLLVRYIHLSEKGKKGLHLEDKRLIAANNRAMVEGCPNISRQP